MTTIYDIAKRAGVSPATVSRVLNGYKDVSVKTRTKVERITKELGYEPSSVARGLATKRSLTIGVFFEDHVNSGLRHPFFQDVLATFKDIIGREGYDLLFFANVVGGKEQSGFEARALQRNVDGLLLLGVPRTDPRLRHLPASRVPCMSVDLDLIGPRAGYLCSDNQGGAIMAMDYLISLGHREIAFIGDRFATKPGHDRMVGYQQALLRYGLQFRHEWILDGDFTYKGGYEAGIRLLEMKELPSAVFCAGDMMAFGAMKAFAEHGVKPGTDISIIGFDDIAMCQYVKPGLTTIRQKKEEMGLQAAIALLRLIEEPQLMPPVITVDTELIVRETVRPRGVSPKPIYNKYGSGGLNEADKRHLERG